MRIIKNILKSIENLKNEKENNQVYTLIVFKKKN